MAIEKKVSVSKPKGDTLDGYGLMEILRAIFPVGSTFTGSVDGTMPDLIAAIGTWVRLEGVFIVAASDSDTDFDYDDIGGAKNHAHPLGNAGGVPFHLDSTSTRVLRNGPGVSISSGNNQSNMNWGGGSGTISSSLGLVGNTNSASGLPPFKAKYVWERTA